MNSKGILTVVSGFSGAGKGTLMKELLKLHSDSYCLSISATTRGPREGEENGREYFFKTKEEFLNMIENDELLEYAQYVDNYYGTPKEFVINKLEQGINVILEIEMQGALKIKAKYPDALLIFVSTKDADTLESRLVGRNTEDADKIHKRLMRAAEESDFMSKYDYIVINDELSQCEEVIHEIITNEKCRVSRNSEFIDRIKNDLGRYLKGEN